MSTYYRINNCFFRRIQISNFFTININSSHTSTSHKARISFYDDFARTFFFSEKRWI
ncbi:hypothetical protein KpUFPRA3_02010 [Klebsiella pneumoniae subsp. pneumoniae]|nr:hypothetical protein KPB2_3429 [Klebsiella pneumoniae Kb677]KMI32196.1 hypothetical protein SM89_03049 [Klebsiella quasipneumoniae]NQE25189.1 hypothetical protein [Klebsiella pneumoniae subsp. pneumoniae]QOK32981.1 hypothetical protein IFY65_02907 [Klebsiella pneumoniae]NQE57118.1 hypothetical protein [Klebsiella pneumoniae subsp. pneumoniae]